MNFKLTHYRRDGQIAHGCLPRPAARLDPVVAIGEGPAQVRHRSLVGGGRADEVAGLRLARPVAGAEDGGALPFAKRDAGSVRG